MQKDVYLLQHSYESYGGYEETKILGVFSSLQEAEKAVLEYKKLPGFKEKLDNFYVDRYIIDKMYWEEGFIN